jgi:hypothetical protein
MTINKYSESTTFITTATKKIYNNKQILLRTTSNRADLQQYTPTCDKEREEIRSDRKSVNPCQPRTLASDREREIRPGIHAHRPGTEKEREEERSGTHAHRPVTEKERGREIQSEIHAHRRDLSLSNPEITLPIRFSFKQPNCKQKN